MIALARFEKAVDRVADGLVARMRAPMAVIEHFEDVTGATVCDLTIPTAMSRTEVRTFGPRHEALDRPVLEQRHRVFVAGVSDCHLLRDGAVTVRGRLIRDSLWDTEHYTRSYGNAVRLPRGQRVKGSVASLLSLWADNHYHWVLDVLPRLATLEEAGLSHLPLVVPSRLGRAQWDSLERLGISDQLVPSDGHLIPDHLVWAASPSYVMHTTSYTAAWLRRRMTPGPVPAPPRRIYVRRAVSRRIANEDAVLRVLERHGFEVLSAEKLDFREQVAAFASAEAVVAPHGAGLVNLAFGTGARVLELFGPDYVNPCFRVLAASAGHDYRYLIGTTAGSAVRQGGDMLIPIDLLHQELEQMMDGLPVPDALDLHALDQRSAGSSTTTP